MILSNNTERHSELNRKAITTLGDTLMNKGDLYAAHFCYLMAQVSFGKYKIDIANNTSSTTSGRSLSPERLVLLGSCHLTGECFEDFAKNESIMLTEVYEYANGLSDNLFVIPEFQPYKFLLALRMLDCGLAHRSIAYLELVAENILRDPSRYDKGFVRSVYDWSDRLRYCSVESENENSTSESGTWIARLQALVENKQVQTWTDLNQHTDSPMMQDYIQQQQQQQIYVTSDYSTMQQQTYDQQYQPTYSQDNSLEKEVSYGYGDGDGYGQQVHQQDTLIYGQG